METTNILSLIKSFAVVAICIFILFMTVKSHIILRNRRNDTIGRKLYRWLIVLFCLNGIYYGLTPFTYTFCFAAILTERLVVYKACRGKKDFLARFLNRLRW